MTTMERRTLIQAIEQKIDPKYRDGGFDPRTCYDEDVEGIIDPGDIVATWFASRCTSEEFREYVLPKKLQEAHDSGLYTDVRDNGLYTRVLGAKRSDGTIDIMDGAHRIVIHHELGRPVPMSLFNWFDLPDGCLAAWKTHSDIWENEYIPALENEQTRVLP
jgi:hypothetical protein